MHSNHGTERSRKVQSDFKKKSRNSIASIVYTTFVLGLTAPANAGMLALFPDLDLENKPYIYFATGIITTVLVLFLFSRHAAKKQAGLMTIVDERTRALKEANLKLKEAAKKADSENKAKSAFLASMSHEIRTPLNGVIGMTNLLNQTELSKDQRDLVKVIEISGSNVVSIINDILDYSKIEAGKIDIEQDPFSLRECVELSLDLFMEQVSSKKLELAYYINDNVPETLIGDTARLRQILVNLIGNAIKFTDAGYIYITVSLLKSVKTHHTIEFSIKDSGIGIPKHQIDRLFKSFSQLSGGDNNNRGGTGLGLAISKKLVEVMGGDLAVQSEEFKGSNFHFRLPYEAISEISLRRNYDELAGKRLLVVEDSEIQKKLIIRYAKSWKMDVIDASSAAEALNITRNKPDLIDLAIIDLSLPDRSGNDLAKELKTTVTSCSETRCISIASSSVIESGPSFDASLSKPIKPHFLAEAFKQVLNQASIDPEDETLTLNANEANNAPPLGEAAEKPLILLVDDNETNRKVGIMLLDKLGYKTVEVDNGKEAIEAIKKQRFEIVLMDVQMPVMDGKEATRKIRELNLGYEPWIIAVTAGAMREDMQRALNAGMNDYLSKPVLLDTLQLALERASSSALDQAST